MSDLTVERDDAVVTLRLAAPPANRLAPALMAALVAALRAADVDSSVDAVVLTGDGDTFCGGLDGAYIEGGGDPVDLATGLIELLRAIPRLGVPLLAAVNGDALASGFSLVCLSDIAVTVDGARLGTVESSLGLWPMIAQVPVIHRLSRRRALQNILTGVPFSAAEAERYDAVNEVVADADALAVAIARWVKLCTRSGAHTARGRRAFHTMLDQSYDAALESSLREFVAMTGPRR